MTQDLRKALKRAEVKFTNGLPTLLAARAAILDFLTAPLPCPCGSTADFDDGLCWRCRNSLRHPDRFAGWPVEGL